MWYHILVLLILSVLTLIIGYHRSDFLQAFSFLSFSVAGSLTLIQVPMLINWELLNEFNEFNGFLILVCALAWPVFIMAAIIHFFGAIVYIKSYKNSYKESSPHITLKELEKFISISPSSWLIKKECMPWNIPLEECYNLYFTDWLILQAKLSYHKTALDKQVHDTKLSALYNQVQEEIDLKRKQIQEETAAALD